MRSSPDASWHKQCEQTIIAHVTQLLSDPKFILDTSMGRKSATSLKSEQKLSDGAVELKRIMSQLNPDRGLEAQMPVGKMLEATYGINKWMVFQKIVARVMVRVVSPLKEILKQEEITPLTIGETRRQLGAMPPALPGVPTMSLLVSTSGFEPDAHELAERTSERIIVLIEPNEAGGWNIHGPVEIGSMLKLLDPETEDSKTARVEAAVDSLGDQLSSGSISAEKVSEITQISLQKVEDTIKSYAKRHRGLVSKRLDGRLLLFREGTTPTGKAIGGENMSLLERIKTLFARKGDNERKISFLSERRAALTQQRETSHEELFKLEKRDADLRKEFKATDSQIIRKRITSQLLQLTKEIERRSQLLQVLNQQINIVSTHLHNLELLQQGKSANLPNSDEIAGDAAKAEEMLAQLQADSELADSVGTSAVFGMSAEEQALYDQLLASTEPVSSPQPITSAEPEQSIPPAPATAPQQKPRESLGEPG